MPLPRPCGLQVDARLAFEGGVSPLPAGFPQHKPPPLSPQIRCSLPASLPPSLPTAGSGNMVPVSTSMLKQIAGRAGRRSSQFQQGLATCCNTADIPRLQVGLLGWLAYVSCVAVSCGGPTTHHPTPTPPIVAGRAGCASGGDDHPQGGSLPGV